MRRREFISLVGGAAAAPLWPLAVRARQPDKLPTIGFLAPGFPASQGNLVAAFAERLRQLGWIEGRSVSIEYRWGEGRKDRDAEIASDFVRLPVDLIVTYSTPGALAAKQATSTIPIVFALVGDPVGTGLVASLARPGANVTGLSNQQVDAPAKRLALLREMVPALRRLGILANFGNPSNVLEMNGLQSAARTVGIETTAPEIRRAEDVAPAFAALKGRVDALYVAGDPLIAHAGSINTLAVGAKLPTMHDFREFAETGGLMSYGPDYPEIFRHAAELADKVLRGTKPAEMPVEQPTKFELVINLKTAKAIGIEVPPTLAARADAVIE